MNRLSVIIPVYNGENYIEKCLDSLINQSYNNLRIVVVDDGSTDKTQKILNNYSSKYKNIEVYHKENEKNISKTRNFLLTKIKSDERDINCIFKVKLISYDGECYLGEVIK